MLHEVNVPPPQVSISSITYYFMIKQPVGYEFTVGTLLDDMGLDRGLWGAVSGFVTRAKVAGMIAMQGRRLDPGRTSALAYYRLIDPKIHMGISTRPGIGSTLGRNVKGRKHEQPPEQLPLQLPDTRPIPERLFDLLHQATELATEMSGHVSLHDATKAQLLEELAKRMGS